MERVENISGTLPSVRLVILGIFWLQIISAFIIFIITKNNLIETKFGTRYTQEEIVFDPSETQRLKFTRKIVPVLRDDRRQEPNLSLPAEVTTGLEFKIVRLDEIGTGVLASGSIEVGDYKKFVSFLKDNQLEDISYVALNSPGGTVSEAILLGEEIRMRKLTTLLSSGAFCFSSCPYVMAGGVKRVFSEHSLLGVHQHYYEDNFYLPIFFAVKSVQSGQALTFQHLKKMGINTDVMEHILSTPPDEIYIFTARELSKYQFSTEIKLYNS